MSSPPSALFETDGIAQTHPAVSEALRDPRLVVARTGGWIAHPTLPRRQLQPLRHLISRVLVFQEGGQHAAIKTALGPELLLPRLQGIRPALLKRLRSALDPAPTRMSDGTSTAGSTHPPVLCGSDLVAELPRHALECLLGLSLPQPLPTAAIARLLRSSSPNSGPDAEVLLEAQEAAVALLDWARRALAESVPPMLRSLSAEEQERCLCLLAFAGTETSQHLLAGLLDRWLHANALQRQQLCASASATIREQLRWQSPIQYTVRRVAEAGIWEGQRLRPGQSLLLHLGRAQRDPMVYSSPSVFLPHRVEGPGLSLGLGLHACLGAALARFQAEVLLEALAMPEAQGWRPTPGAAPWVADPFDPAVGLVCRPLALSMVWGAALGAENGLERHRACS